MPEKSFNLQFYCREQMFYCGQKRRQILYFYKYISQPLIFEANLLF